METIHFFVKIFRFNGSCNLTIEMFFKSSLDEFYIWFYKLLYSHNSPKKDETHLGMAFLKTKTRITSLGSFFVCS